MRFLERPPGSASLRFSHAAPRTRKALSSSMIVPASEAPTKGRRLRPSLKPLTRPNQGGSRPSGGVPYSSPISPQSSASPPSAGQNSPKTRPSSPESMIRRSAEHLRPRGVEFIDANGGGPRARLSPNVLSMRLQTRCPKTGTQEAYRAWLFSRPSSGRDFDNSLVWPEPY